MKIRHKTLGVEFPIKHLRSDVYIGAGHYYETEGGSFIPHGDPEWEVVPTMVWKDVTAYCQVGQAIGVEDKRMTILYKQDSMISYDILHTTNQKNMRLRWVGAYNGCVRCEAAFVVEVLGEP